MTGYVAGAGWLNWCFFSFVIVVVVVVVVVVNLTIYI